MTVKKAGIAAALLSLAAALSAAELSIAGFLTDPGFEKKHEPNAQINAPGAGTLNGWSAFPEKSNPWTFVGYTEKGGSTTPDRLPALEPAEGNSYLRMFTFKSSSWLALKSPEFPVKAGNVYSVAFDVAVDRSAPMAKLQLFLEMKGKRYCTVDYNLLQLKAGWNTLVYRVAYDGPDGNARLAVRCERENNAPGGSLNFDHFRPAKAGDGETEQAADRSETGGLMVALPFDSSPLPIRIATLRQNTPRDFRLGVPAGRYHLLVKVKSSDRSGNEGDSMFGGYNYLMPENTYSFRLDGRALLPAISGRMAEAVGRDAAGNVTCSGWLSFRDPVTVGPDSTLAVSCSKVDGFVARIVLLNETEWKAEQLRMSNLFHSPPGSGFGNAWAATVERPELVYPVDSLRDFLDGLKTFRSRGESGPELARLQEEGETLAARAAAFLPREATPETAKEGAATAAAWEAYRKHLFSAFASIFPAGIEAQLSAVDAVVAKANVQCHAGREADFHAGIARRYLETARQELREFPAGAVQDFTFFTRLLTNLDNGAHALGRAQKFAEQPQATVEFPQFFVKRDPALPEFRPGGTERLLLSGIWQFAPGKPDVLPSRWMDVPIPNDSPFVFYNPANISDAEFGQAAGAYWHTAGLRDLWFQTSFTVPAGWNGGRLFLKFDEVMMNAEVFVNGRFAGSHCGGLIPFELDVTKLAVPGRLNHLLVLVSSAEKVAMGEPSDVPRHHKLKAHYLYPVTESHVYGLRISGDVELLVKPPVRAEDVYVRTSLRDGTIAVRTTLVNDGPVAIEAQLKTEVRNGADKVLALPERSVALAPGESRTVETRAPFPHPNPWGIGGEYGDPHNRYTLASTVVADGKSATEYTPFAFREMEIRGRKLFLNGKELALQGSSTTVAERVTVLNNKESELYMNRARKEANINFLRYHRFNLQNWLVAACDDAGILAEGEGPWWGLFAPTDINGKDNYDDPVWLENCREYYVKVMRKFRNAPSMLFFSLENETLSAENARTIARFREWAKAEAPHLILMNHSHASATLPEAPVAVLHDYDLGTARVAEYSGLAKKPVVIGEFWNPEVSRAIQDERQARGAERLMRMWLDRTIRAYRKAGADGVMPYTFTGLGGISTKRDTTTCGPWSNLYMAQPQTVFALPVAWPANSGGGGIHAEKIWLDRMTMRRPVNFFDPERPAYTPSEVGQAYRDTFGPVPLDPIRRSPELLVEATDGGRPLAGINVFAQSADTGRRAVKTDAQGRAWFLFDMPGTYEITLEADGKPRQKTVKLDCLPLGRPGWEYLPRLRFDAAAGTAEFIPGQTLPEVSAVKTETGKKTAALRPDKSVYANRPAVGPDGFIRRWLVLGPFPNYGSRTNREPNGLGHDFLGGEAEILPALDLPPVKAEFKRNPEAFWKPGTLELRWDWLTSAGDKVDLTGAFLLDRPGLDGIIQYIFGYAACYVRSDADREAELTIGSDDGFKIWLNHRPVGELRAYRGCKPDENRFRVKLRKGWNPLLVKIEQETGGYEFALRFLTPDGKPLRLETSLTPPAAAKSGVIRDWMLLGPFPNAGTRPACVGLAADFLGDEAKIHPDDREHRAEFPAYEKAYYSAGTVMNRWKAYRAPEDGTVDLGEALLRPDHPGLDVSPLQYVAAYAAATVNAPEAGEYELRLSSFNGVRVRVNGKLVIDDERRTFNRDPNSPVLPPSFRKEATCKIRLQQGENTILVKADVDYGPFDFTLTLIPPEG